jgi:Flp pilus assembly protein TadG
MGAMFRRGRRGERGATTVEFALVSIPAILLVLGTIQYGWYFYVAEQTSGAASSLARKLAVGDCWTGNEALDFAQDHANQVNSVTKSPTSITATTARGTAITVTVTANAEVVGFFPMPSGGVVTRVVTTRLEDNTAATC